jgi:hypothetical protein
MRCLAAPERARADIKCCRPKTSYFKLKISIPMYSGAPSSSAFSFTQGALGQQQKEKPRPGGPGLKDGRRGVGVRGTSSILSRHVDGGFAVGCSSFSRHGSPRSFSCATTWSATAYRSPSVSPSFNPRMILRYRIRAKATAYSRTSPLVMPRVEHIMNISARRYILYAVLQFRLATNE